MSARRRRSLGPEGNRSPPGASDTLQKERRRVLLVRVTPARLQTLPFPTPPAPMSSAPPPAPALSHPALCHALLSARPPSANPASRPDRLSASPLLPSSQSWPRGLWGRGGSGRPAGNGAFLPSLPPRASSLAVKTSGKKKAKARHSLNMHKDRWGNTC